jgi:hypothetical protein
MKRFLMLVGVAVVAAAMYVAASPASQQAKGPTAKQFKALKKQVTALGHTVKGLKTVAAAEAAVITDCLQVAVPVNQFGDPDGSQSGTTEGYVYGKGTFPGDTANPVTGYTTGLDVSSSSDTGAAWFVGALSTNGGGAVCNADLASIGGLRHAAARVGIQLRHAATRAPSFVPHGR